MMVDAEAVALRITIGKQTSLQHTVRREADTWNYVRWRKGSLLDIGEAHGRGREQFLDDIRFVRTALVDPNAPDLAGLRPPQLAWLRQANRDLQQPAAELDVGRASMLGAVPLDPVLQWREQLITDSDVWARHVANQATIEAFESIAKSIVDKQAWERL